MGMERAGWEKVIGEARSGSGSVSVSVSISIGRVMGFGHEKLGGATVLLRAVLTPFGSEVGAVHEGQVPTRAGVDPDPDPDFDFDFDFDSYNDQADRQLSYSYSYSYSYSPHPRVRERVPLRCVRVRFWAEPAVVRKAHRGIAEGTAAPDGEDSRRGAEGEWGGLQRAWLVRNGISN
jgi:hypothetical protein